MKKSVIALLALLAVVLLPMAGFAQQAAPPYCSGQGSMTSGVLAVTLPAGCCTAGGFPQGSAICFWSDATTAANGLGKCVYSQSACTLTITSNITSGNSDVVSWILHPPQTVVIP